MADTPSQGGNVFTNKIGPLPMWGWVSIVGGGIVVWAVYKRKKAGTTSSTSGTASTSGAYGPYNQPPTIFQSYVTTPPVNVTTTSPGATTGTGTQTQTQTTPPAQTPPSNVPMTPAQNAPLTVSYLPGGYPGGVAAATAAGAPAQTSGAAYNFSWNQIQQMGFPNLRGMTLAQAQKALASYQGGAYHIGNVSGTPGTPIVSFTPYSTGGVNVGLS